MVAAPTQDYAGAKDLLLVHAVRASLSRCRALAMGDAPETATVHKRRKWARGQRAAGNDKGAARDHRPQTLVADSAGPKVTTGGGSEPE